VVTLGGVVPESRMMLGVAVREVVGVEVGVCEKAREREREGVGVWGGREKGSAESGREEERMGAREEKRAEESEAEREEEEEVAEEVCAGVENEDTEWDEVRVDVTAEVEADVCNSAEESEGAISDRHVTCASNSATETTHVTTEPVSGSHDCNNANNRCL